MHTDDQKYYDGPEFAALLQRYEAARRQGRDIYLDVFELADLCDYYTQIRADMESAQQVVALAKRLHPEAALTKVLDARLLMAAGNVEEAVRICATIDDDNDREVQFLRAELLVMNGHAADALTYIEHIADETDDDLDYLLYDAIQIFLDHELYDEATTLTQRLNTLAPDWYKTWLTQADLLLCMDKYKAALPFIERMLDVDPFDTEAWNWQAEAYYNLERYDEAIASLDYALAVEPTSQRSLLLKAWALTRSQREQEAHDILTTLQQQAPDDAQAWIADAYALTEMKCWPDVVMTLDRAAQCPNADSQAIDSTRELYAHAHARMGHLDTALDYVAQMERAGTEASTTYDGLRAELCVEARRPDMGETYLQAATDKDPDLEGELVDLMAYYLYEMDYPERALPHTQHLLACANEAMPEGEIHTRIAACYLAQDAYIAALPHVAKAMELKAANLSDYLATFFPAANPTDYYDYCYYCAYGHFPQK